MYIQNVNLDVNAQPDANAKPCLRLSQNENGRVLMIRIIGVDIPEGSTANLAGVKPDGNVYSKAGTVEGNVVSINEDIQMTAVSGAWNAKITVVNDGNNICTARIRVVVDASVVPGDAIPSDSQLDGIVAECQAYAESAKNAAYGSPLTANTAADMTDQDRVYVYTGSETGYTAGHWYYYDGSAWADGGVYNAVAVQTDTTLTQAGKAADAKKTGDEISTLKEDLNNLYQSLNLNLIANSYWTVSGSPIGAPVAYNGWSRTDRLPCKAGETIKITSTVKSGYNIFFNTDADGDINQTFTVQTGYNEFKVPSGAHYYALSNTTAGMQNTIVQQIIDVNDVVSKSDVNQLAEEVEEVSDILETVEIYKDIDFSSATVGYYVTNTGVYSENNAFCILQGISLKKGQTIHIKLRGTTTVATLAKSLGNNQYEPLLIGQGGSSVSDQEYIASEDMTVAISYSKTYDHTGYIFTDVPNMLGNKSFYCTPDSGFYSALEVIRADNSSGMRTLYVQAGEYDLYDELGGNDYANSCIPDESYVPPATAWKHFSVVCPDRLKIVGIGEVILKMNIPANTWAEGAIPNSVLTPLSMRYGCEVENIKVECTNTRYGIHIEGSGEAAYRNQQYIFRDVTIEYTYTGEGYNSAIGCGLNANDNLILDNCVLKIIGASGNGIAGHLNDGSSNVYVNNSFVNAPTTDFDVKWNTKGKDSRFRFLNTVLNKITMSNGNLGQTPYNIIYEMVRTDATMKRPSDTSITMPTIVNYGSNLVIDEWT